MTSIRPFVAGMVAAAAVAGGVVLVDASTAYAAFCTHTSHGHPAAYHEYLGQFTDGGQHYHRWKVYPQSQTPYTTVVACSH